MKLSENNTTMSSREIAELTGKIHKNVLRDCDNLNENYEKMGMAQISAVNYKADNGQVYREYHLTRMQTFDLMTGYNTELRIKVNRRWEELETRNKYGLTTPSRKQLAQWVIELEEQNEKAQLEIKALEQKTELMNKVLNAHEKIDIGQAAKILELPFGRNTLFQKLREKGVLFKNRNEPKQEYVQRGYFVLKEKFIERNNQPGFVVVKVLVTQKGLEFISRLFNAVTSRKKLAIMQ